MPIAAAAIIGGASVIGGAMQADAANDASRRAADAAAFRPFGVSGGSGQISMTPSGMTMNLDPRLQRAQSALFSQGAGAIESLGAFDPTQVSRDYYNQAMQLMNPEQARARSSLEQRLFAQGRLGSTGGINQFSGLLGKQEMARQALAHESLFKGLAARGEQLNYARGLFSTGMGMEDPAYRSAALALQGAGASSAAGANQAGYLAQGGYSPLGMGLMGASSALAGMSFGSAAPTSAASPPPMGIAAPGVTGGAPMTGGSPMNPYGYTGLY